MLDGSSRFWIASQVANAKHAEDVRSLFIKSQERAGKKPKTLLSDGSRNFIDAHERMALKIQGRTGTTHTPYSLQKRQKHEQNGIPQWGN